MYLGRNGVMLAPILRRHVKLSGEGTPVVSCGSIAQQEILEGGSMEEVMSRESLVHVPHVARMQIPFLVKFAAEMGRDRKEELSILRITHARSDSHTMGSLAKYTYRSQRKEDEATE